jgi:hypothetical protein
VRSRAVVPGLDELLSEPNIARMRGEVSPWGPHVRLLARCLLIVAEEIHDLADAVVEVEETIRENGGKP